MTRYHAPVADLEFLLGDVLAIEELLTLPEFADADWMSVRNVLSEGARFAEEILAPINAEADRQGASISQGAVSVPAVFKPAWQAISRDGWLGLDLPVEYRGQALPRLLQAAFAEMTNGACVSFCMLSLMSRAAARLLIEHASDDLVAAFVPDLIAGETSATICISEPQAGSDVGRIQSRAVPAEDGTYRLTGTKIWISFGDHDLTDQIAHMVLARTGDAVGTRGISLFLVPKFRLPLAGQEPRTSPERNTVIAQSLEQKMGLHASPTCVLDFDNAQAFCIGEQGRGLNSLFTMVNTMRLEVALQGVAIAGAATDAAYNYAQQRSQGGRPDEPPLPIIRHPDVRRTLLTMRARTEGLRALTLEAARQLDLSEHAPDEKIRAEAEALSSWLLPICKAAATDGGSEVSNLAIQVHGGYGYVQETGIEQYVRDARVGSIYEGTNGIQALDLVTRKLVADQGRRRQIFVEQINETLIRTERKTELEQIGSAVTSLLTSFERCSDALLQSTLGERDQAAGATPYLRLAALLGCAWMWLRMADAASSDVELHRRKHHTAKFFAVQLAPEGQWLESQVLAGAATVDGLLEDSWPEGRS